MFEPKVKIDRALYESLKTAAKNGGYASVEEFITYVLEKAAADAEKIDSESEVRKRLQGLGYVE